MHAINVYRINMIQLTLCLKWVIVGKSVCLQCPNVSYKYYAKETSLNLYQVAFYKMLKRFILI